MSAPGFLRVSKVEILLLVAIGVTVFINVYLVYYGDIASWAVTYPEDWDLQIATSLTLLLNFLTDEFDLGFFTFAELTRGVSWVVEQPMLFIKGMLSNGFTFYNFDGGITHIPPLPWTGITVVFCVFGWWAGGIKTVGLVGATFLYFAVFGLWEASMMTLASIIVAVIACLVIGILLGILGYRSRAANMILTPIYDVMQTMPVFSYLVPVVLFFGFSPVAALMATIIFAMPPMARVTTLALQRVPSNVSDFGEMAGCTRRQKMWQVLLPASRQNLLIGVNQIIMLSLAMVIVASVIGAGGLGANVYRGLKALRIGDAVEAGAAITVMAIMLDRVSMAVTMRRKIHSLQSGKNLFQRHPLILISASVLVVLVPLGQWFPILQTYPDAATISTGKVWNELIVWINESYYNEISTVRDGAIIYLMKPVKEFLLSVPWLSFITIVGVAAFALGGQRLAIICISLLLFIAVTGYWKQAMISLYLVSIAVVVALVIAIPIGIWAAISDRVNQAVTVIIDTIQTLPTFVYLIPVVMLFSIGEFPALVAIVLYALPPGIRYTKQGIRNTPRSILEAADLSGCTRAQRLFHVEIPLALPYIMLGVNQTVMMAFGMLVITALVGTRGLEHDTLVAISKVRPGEGIVAGLGIAFLSIIVDRLITTGSNLLRRRLRIGTMLVAV